MRRWVLGTIAAISFTSAITLTGYLGWVYWDSHRQTELFHADNAKATNTVEISGSEEEPKTEPQTITWEKRPKRGQRIGTLRIPSIGLKVPMWAGTDHAQLSKGVGVHNLGMPGESELVGIAGHRNTAFRHAGKIQIGDLIILETDCGRFVYRVRRIWIADKDDRSVIRRTGEPVVVGYTCYPFDSLNSPQQRYIFEAEMLADQ